MNNSNPFDIDFSMFPVLNIGDKMGATGDIDFIQLKDMTSDIMVGQDIQGRFFIAFVIDGKHVETIFQRSSDTWAMSTCYWNSDPICPYGKIQIQDYPHVKKKIKHLIDEWSSQ